MNFKTDNATFLKITRATRNSRRSHLKFEINSFLFLLRSKPEDERIQDKLQEP
jgi:hypothetical protein